MDGFDDLLAPTRQALESNPFADDFTGSSSSDPWASPFGAPSHDDPFSSTSFNREHEDPYSTSANPYADLTPTQTPVDDHEQQPGPREDVVEPTTPAKAEHEEEKEEATKEPADPLDSAAIAAQDDEEDNRPLGILRTPGFRESVAPQTSTPPSTQTPESAPHSPVAAEAPKHTVASPSEIQAQHSFSSVVGTSSKVVSPLEPSSNVLENSLAGLTLGADDSGSGSGWNAQTDNSGWGHTELPPPPSTIPAADEDSDDDKPINQTLKRTSQDDTRQPVRALLLMGEGQD